MIFLHKVFVGLIVSSLVFIFPSATIKPIVDVASSINAGRHIALPEIMAWRCADTVTKRHSKKIKLAQTIDVDPVIKRKMIDFELADYERDLKASCGIADLSELPPKDTLRKIKP